MRLMNGNIFSEFGSNSFMDSMLLFLVDLGWERMNILICVVQLKECGPAIKIPVINMAQMILYLGWCDKYPELGSTSFSVSFIIIEAEIAEKKRRKTNYVIQ